MGRSTLVKGKAQQEGGGVYGVSWGHRQAQTHLRWQVAVLVAGRGQRGDKNEVSSFDSYLV